jgi:predicted nucleotidyltransferase
MSLHDYPEPFRSDIDSAVRILKEHGAKDVYLFGSILRTADPASIGDIDIAVSGLDPRKYFKAYASLMMALEHPFDLVDLDDDAAFVRVLREDGQLERVA